MLTSLSLESFRKFNRYQVSGLARVNLLVGQNNSGKTTLLEAVHFLASGGNPAVLTAVAHRRGEVVLDDGEERPWASTLLRHFFPDHDIRPGHMFAVRSDDGLGRVTATVRAAQDLSSPDEPGPDEGGWDPRQLALFSTVAGPTPELALVVQLESPDGQSHVYPPLPLTSDGRLWGDPSYQRRRAILARRRTPPQVQFISPESLEPGTMTDMWDTAIREGREGEVVEALRIIEPDLDGLFFMAGRRVYRYGAGSGVLAAIRGHKRRIPLGSYGDGMRRLLALSLSLINTQHGVLLLDEVDTGLHYSVMGDMWLTVVRAATLANVQVFATTHSLDCVRGLAHLCEHHPDLRGEVALVKVDPDLEEAVTLRDDQIRQAARQDIEVR